MSDIGQAVVAGVRDLLPVLRERAQEAEDARDVPADSVIPPSGPARRQRGRPRCEYAPRPRVAWTLATHETASTPRRGEPPAGWLP